MKLDRYTVGERYGKTLLKLVIEKNQAEAIYQKLLTLHEICHRIPDISDILSDSRLKPYEKDSVMGELVTGFGEVIQNFLRVVYEYRRMYGLLLMTDEYEWRYDEYQGLILGSVTTTIPLSEKQHQAVEEKAAQLLGYERAHLIDLIGPSIVGGVVIEANYRVIGGSIRKQLEYTQQKLLK